MDQIGRNLTDSMNAILNGKRYLIQDRDPLFNGKFLDTIASVGVESVKIAAAFTEPKCLCGPLRPQYERILPGPNDPFLVKARCAKELRSSVCIITASETTKVSAIG